MSPTSKVSAALLGVLLCASSAFAQGGTPLTAREQQALAQAIAALKASFVTSLDSARLSSATGIRELLKDVDPEAGEYFDEDDIKSFGNRPQAPAVPAPSFSSTRGADGALVLRIGAFGPRLLPDVIERLTQEWQQQPYPGLLLDLRASPGGLVTTAVGLAALFLPANAVVAQSAGRADHVNHTYRASLADVKRFGEAAPNLAALPVGVRNTPLVVLVDDKTAAGAELLAAALKDHRRAVVIGRKTLGRASLQTVAPLANGGAIKFTTGYWLSPAGHALHGVGVTPDIAVADADEAQAQALRALAQAKPPANPVK